MSYFKPISMQRYQNGKMIYFQDWKQGVKSCSWFPKKEKGVRRSDCERLPKFCRRAISTLLQFLDTLFLIAASSIFIVTTYCTNIFDRNYIALFSGGWGFLLEINLFTNNNRVPTNNCLVFFQIRWLSKSGFPNRFIDTLFLIVAATYF